MLDETDFARIDRFLAGECTPGEAAAVERWIEGDADRRALVATLRSTARAGDWHADSSSAWARVRQEALQTAATRVARFPAPRPAPLRIWAAAAAIALVALGVQLWNLRQRSSRPTTTAAMAEAVAPLAQRATVTLPDGSRVLLAPESRLRWAPGLRGGTREVSLEGEAFFAVAHDAARPFIVRAAAATARVLGTRFLVRSRAGEGPDQVVVAEGRVLVRPVSGEGGRVLATGDLGTVRGGDRLEVRHGVSLDAELDWTDGRLVFQDAPVPAAFARLERWYGMRLVAADTTIAARRFSGTIENLPANELVQALSLALDARAQLRPGVVAFYARTPAAARGP